MTVGKNIGVVYKQIKMNKTKLIITLKSALSLRQNRYDGTLRDTDIGFFLYDISEALNKNPQFFKDVEIAPLFEAAMTGIKELVQQNIVNYPLICDIFCPGRELFPDKEKYPWWWLPETLMNTNQLEKWKKYLKSRNYKYN